MAPRRGGAISSGAARGEGTLHVATALGEHRLVGVAGP